jgi:tRNA A-37 threonylcarbamoyl transferase component Bud32
MMLLFSQHPSLAPRLAREFREHHLELFQDACFIAANNEQVVKSFPLHGQEFVIKFYPEKGPRANLRSLLAISRAMNSFKKSAQLSALGVKSPDHLFVARHSGLFTGSSYLIMRKSAGTSLHSMIFDQPEQPISDQIIGNLATMTRRIHAAGLTHGDLHAGNIFVLADESVELIDLDNIRPNLKRQKRDRERLLRSFDSRPDLREKLFHTLAANS